MISSNGSPVVSRSRRLLLTKLDSHRKEGSWHWGVSGRPQIANKTVTVNSAATNFVGMSQRLGGVDQAARSRIRPTHHRRACSVGTIV